MDKEKFVIGYLGPFGAGKTTLMKETLLTPELRLEKIVRYTSRLQGEKEVEGDTYYFRSDEEIARLNKQRAFLECIRNDAGYYATSIAEVLSKLQYADGLVVDIGLDASRILKPALAAFGIRYFDIFVVPGDPKLLQSEQGKDTIMDTLAKRVEARGNRDFETKLELLARRLVARRWLDEAVDFMYHLDNSDGKQKEAVQTVLSIVKKELLLMRNI